MDVAKRHQDQLTRIKTSIKKAHDYFKPNYDRYNEFRRFVFETSLKNEELTLLTTISKPQLEFNVLEAYISRLLGEFSKQEPDIEVSADDQNTVDPMVIKLVEQHLRHVLTDAKNHHTKYEVYKDLLSGGFSTLKVTTDYANPMSFHQVINIERAEPTLCGFDQLAKYSHKGDGAFCFELYPKSEEEFELEYPDVSLSHLSFRRDFAGFNWSYLNDNSRFLMVADYYEKKKKDVMIVMLRDKRVMTKEKYNKMLETWGAFEAPPAIMGKPRKTTIETIERYRCIENKILEHEETDFTHLPLIFVDGNSVMIKTPKNGNIRQFTRPYVYHAKGAQRLKNYAGIALANEIENIVQHKFIIKKEALPKEEELLQALKDIQKPNNIIVNAFYEMDPDKPIPEPIREIMKIPAPPETLQAFTGSDSLIQNILGSYDASLGINDNQLSGVALVEAATQSNAAAMPYIVGYLQGYQRAAQIYVDLMPKYVTTPRTLPIVDERGRKGYVMVNQQQGMNVDFDTNALNVTVKAGASFAVQKSRTLLMVKEMMGMSPLFGQFIAEKGLDFVLDNMEGKGVDQLKMMVDGWLKEMQQQKQMAMQQQQNDPAMMKGKIEMAKLQQQAQVDQAKFQVDMAKLQQEKEKVAADVQISHDQNAVSLVKAMTERMAKGVDLKIKHMDVTHKHLHNHAALRHEMSKPTPIKGTGK
jgi:hypothetical protein